MHREDALTIFHSAIEAVKPSVFMHEAVRIEGEKLLIGEQQYDLSGVRRIFVTGAGKASAAMAIELESIMGDHITGGIVITKYGHALPSARISFIEAGHPLPDSNGILGTERIKQMLQGMNETDLVICLISGGASALVADQPGDCPLEELRLLSELLLQSGASIREINTIRKHLSTLKGGQLSRLAFPARVASVILSDVPGNSPDIIGSGLTVPDKSSFADAWNILQQYQLNDRVPASVSNRLMAGMKGAIPDTPGPDDPLFKNTYNYLAASNRSALQQAAAKAAQLGYNPVLISDKMTGEAKTVASEIIDSVLSYTGTLPACLLWGGETTVTIRGNGKGGRNQELALACLAEFDSRSIKKPVAPVILCGGTDGSDAETDVTGAYIDSSHIEMVYKNEIDPLPFLLNNDSYHFFEKAGGHIKTGPTHTNVMDLVIGLVSSENEKEEYHAFY